VQKPLDVNVVIKVAYDGTRYLGWQKVDQTSQPNFLKKKCLTVENELELLLQKILQSPVKLQAASRTDKGVHATEQVVNFFTDNHTLNLDRLHYSLNSLLPSDICVLSVSQAPSPTFHPTLDAKAKQYQYLIAYGKTALPFWRFTHWNFSYELDIEKMQLAADIIKGKHNFAAFCNRRKDKEYSDTVRTVFSIDIELLEDKRLSILMMADNFLYKMARNIAGTLAYVGAGKMTLDEVAAIFVDNDRVSAGITAPACGLFLHKVFY
jgi:tRNA pseudouridine38-40 synthase